MRHATFIGIPNQPDECCGYQKVNTEFLLYNQVPRSPVDTKCMSLFLYEVICFRSRHYHEDAGKNKQKTLLCLCIYGTHL